MHLPADFSGGPSLTSIITSAGHRVCLGVLSVLLRSACTHIYITLNPRVSSGKCNLMGGRFPSYILHCHYYACHPTMCSMMSLHVDQSKHSRNEKISVVCTYCIRRKPIIILINNVKSPHMTTLSSCLSISPTNPPYYPPSRFVCLFVCLFVCMSTPFSIFVPFSSLSSLSLLLSIIYYSTGGHS